MGVADFATSTLVVEGAMSTFIKENPITVNSFLQRFNATLLSFPVNGQVMVRHPSDRSPDFIRLGLLHEFANLNFEKSVLLSILIARNACVQNIKLTESQRITIKNYADWICILSQIDTIEFHFDGGCCLFGTEKNVKCAERLVHMLCNENSFETVVSKAPLQVPNLFATPESTPIKSGNIMSPPVENSPRTSLFSESTALRSPFQNGQLKARSPSVQKQSFVYNDLPLLPSTPGIASMQSSQKVNALCNSGDSRTTLSPSLFSPVPQNSSIVLNEQANLPSPSAILYETVRFGKIGNLWHLMFYANCVDAPRLIGTRGANKKRLEQMTKTSLMFHTECRNNGRFPIEISSDIPSSCLDARMLIIGYLTSAATSPGAETPSKPRTPNKIMLQLSPKKQKPNTDDDTEVKCSEEA